MFVLHAAAQFEQGDYEGAIKTEDDAVEKGRELRADYKIIAKWVCFSPRRVICSPARDAEADPRVVSPFCACRAFARAGSAYERKTDFANAIKYFKKSLAEHRTPEVLAKIKEAERLQKEAEAKAYEDPAESDKARDEGNKLFKGGDFAGSVKSYTEAIKRNPRDARGYTNRAAAYTKLLALAEALKDAEMAIKV